jgi:hypothetical protein
MTAQGLELWRETLASVLDDLGTGVALFERGGSREVDRNARLDELLDEEPERERLAGFISQLALALDDRADRPGLVRGQDLELELTGGTYRLVTTRGHDPGQTRYRAAGGGHSGSGGSDARSPAHDP